MLRNLEQKNEVRLAILDSVDFSNPQPLWWSRGQYQVDEVQAIEAKASMDAGLSVYVELKNGDRHWVSEQRIHLHRVQALVQTD